MNVSGCLRLIGFAGRDAGERLKAELSSVSQSLAVFESIAVAFYMIPTAVLCASETNATLIEMR